ncbi:hypothetical protein AVEN_70456-1 [Araneus ventricosus]|uniref:Integrase catalytic domain-containing protein n=1 Tax=Araneus ventricosus TaxID=182803 RepID=A0A4Y2SFB9_ARAVE|nr:hypothetical protein AVEN_70456-1 [Araneus ventricosus]
MALDILGRFPVTTKDNRHVLVLMGYFTKWPEAIPIPDQEDSNVAEELVRIWTSRYCVLMILHSDQGTNFNSAVFTELCKLSFRNSEENKGNSVERKGFRDHSTSQKVDNDL